MENTLVSTNMPYILLAAVFAVLLLVGSVWYFRGFMKELRYLNSEVKRTRGEERLHWKSQRRRLWLSLFPFVKY